MGKGICPEDQLFNRVANHTLRGQLFLNVLRQECPGWSTAHKQEWDLFLLEHLLNNAASMRRKECQRCSQTLQAEMAEVMAPEHPSVWTLLGSMDAEILKIAKQVYQGECAVGNQAVLPHQWHEECIRKLHQELAPCMARAAYRMNLGQLGPLQEAGDVPMTILPHGLIPPQLGLGVESAK